MFREQNFLFRIFVKATLTREPRDRYVGTKVDPTRENVVRQRDDEKHNELRAKMAAGVRLPYLHFVESGIQRSTHPASYFALSE